MTEEKITEIMREVCDLPPWAYTYRERSDDLLEVRACELEAILRAALTDADTIMHRKLAKDC